MITVRIPKEIREYKEKIFLGLSARQLIATIVTLAICIPLYWFGRKFIHEDLLAWLVMREKNICLLQYTLLIN